jgi:beta-mannanase
MDRKNLQDSVHSPADYIAAWKHVRGIFTEVGATNAGWVWCPLATGFQDGRAQQYYPGDRQVDWICADVYAGRDMRSFGETMAPFMAWAAQHPRPAVLGEFGVTEGSPGQKAAWFRDARAYVLAYPQLKALVYFSARKESKPSYDFSVDSSPGALEAFRALVAEPRLHAPPPRGLR